MPAFLCIPNSFLGRHLDPNAKQSIALIQRDPTTTTHCCICPLEKSTSNVGTRHDCRPLAIDTVEGIRNIRADDPQWSAHFIIFFFFLLLAPFGLRLNEGWDEREAAGSLGPAGVGNDVGQRRRERPGAGDGRGRQL